MPQENFHASVQYNDSKGTAAADDHDNRPLSRYLEQKGLLQDSEMLVGVEMWSGEVHKETQDRDIFVTALVAKIGGRDDLNAALRSGNALHVRKIRLEMPLNQFFGFFKRFQITISGGGLLDGRDITFDA